MLIIVESRWWVYDTYCFGLSSILYVLSFILKFLKKRVSSLKDKYSAPYPPNYSELLIPQEL